MDVNRFFLVSCNADMTLNYRKFLENDKRGNLDSRTGSDSLIEVK